VLVVFAGRQGFGSEPQAILLHPVSENTSTSRAASSARAGVARWRSPTSWASTTPTRCASTWPPPCPRPATPSSPGRTLSSGTTTSWWRPGATWPTACWALPTSVSMVTCPSPARWTTPTARCWPRSRLDSRPWASCTLPASSAPPWTRR